MMYVNNVYFTNKHKQLKFHPIQKDLGQVNKSLGKAVIIVIMLTCVAIFCIGNITVF